MILKRCNDWLKVFLVYLIVGVFFYTGSLFAEKLSDTTNMYVLTACVIITVIYYIFAGIFIKEVKTYKIVLVYASMFAVQFFTKGFIGRVLNGGPYFIINFFGSFLEEGWEKNFEEVASYVLFSLIACTLIPLVTVLLGKWIGKCMDKNKQSAQE